MKRKPFRVALLLVAVAILATPWLAYAADPATDDAAATAAEDERATLRATAEAGLTNEQRDVRHFSILALGALYGDKELKDFQKYAEDADPVVRNGALVALALRGDKKALGAIETSLGAVTVAADLDAALMTLVHPLPEGTRVEILKKILKKPANEELRLATVRYLVRHGSDEHLALIEGLDKLKDTAVRDAIVAALIASPRPASLRQAEALLGASDVSARRAAVELAAAIADHDAWQLVARALGDADETLRARAEELLIARRHPAALPVLQARLAENPKDFATIKLLLDFDGVSLVSELEPLVKAEHPSLAQEDYNQVLALIAASRTDSAKALVRTKLASSFEADRIAGAYAIGFTADTGFTAEATALLDDGSLEIRKAVAESLGRLRDSAALDAMGKKLSTSSTERDVKLRLIRAMGEIGDARAATHLQFLIGDRDFELRLAAIDALAQVKAQDATRAIELVTNDADPVLRWRAVVALFRIDPVVYGERLKKAVKDAPEAAFFETLATLDADTRAKLEDEVLRSERASLALGLVREWAAQGRAGLPKLRTALDLSRDVDVTRAALEALAPFAEAEDQARIEAFLSDPERRIRLLAVRTLLTFDKTATEGVFRKQLAQDDPLFKAIGVYGLAR